MTKRRRQKATIGDSKESARRSTSSSVVRGSDRKITPYLIGLFFVVVISLGLNSVALDWGRSGLVPWQPDSIEGVTTVREMGRLFKPWTNKYPRVQFLINSAFYSMLLEPGEQYPTKVVSRDGQTLSKEMDMARLDKMAWISRVISVVMGSVIVVMAFITAILLFDDYLAGLLAAFALAITQLFVFYCHQGNVDIPCMFWFVLGTCLLAKAMRTPRLRYFIPMGLCFSLSICTKDFIGGYMAGTALAFWLAKACQARAEGARFSRAFLSIFTKETIAAIVAFLLMYALMQDALTAPSVFAKRMSIWIGGRGVVDYNKDFVGQLPLLLKAFGQLYLSMGWPLLLAVVISAVYLIWRKPLKAAFLLLPLLTLYLIIVVNIKMVHPRYFIPAFFGLSIVAGKGLTDFLKCAKIPVFLRGIAVGGIFLLSLLYCIGLDLEMVNDTRVRTERWFRANVSRDKTIGVGMYNRVYAPRLYLDGYAMICPWISTKSDRTYPDYLIMTSSWARTKGDSEKDFRKRLANNELGYRQSVRFTPAYLYPARTVFGIAGWFMEKHMLLSPDIVVYSE